MVSVIIPLYNKEAFIEQAVRSVLHQDFEDFELIIVNDGSTDGSLGIIENIQDERIRIIDQQNSGVSVARNVGIQEARFEWISFLDADDWWSENFLSSMMDAVRTYPDHRIFASGRTLIFPDGMKRYHHEYLPKEGMTNTENYFKVISKYLPLVNSSNCLISRELIVENGMFRPGQRKHEDHDLWIRLARNQDVVFINKPLSFYRKTESDSVSRQNYRHNDFITYLNTIIEVQNELDDPELTYFKRYIKNFVFVTYLKNYWSYSRIERKEVLSPISELLKNWRLLFLRVINILPFNVYSILKILRG